MPRDEIEYRAFVDIEIFAEPGQPTPAVRTIIPITVYQGSSKRRAAMAYRDIGRASARGRGVTHPRAEIRSYGWEEVTS